jgi:hypothetical protein
MTYTSEIATITVVRGETYLTVEASQSVAGDWTVTAVLDEDGNTETLTDSESRLALSLISSGVDETGR